MIDTLCEITFGLDCCYFSGRSLENVSSSSLLTQERPPDGPRFDGLRRRSRARQGFLPVLPEFLCYVHHSTRPPGLHGGIRYCPTPLAPHRDGPRWCPSLNSSTASPESSKATHAPCKRHTPTPPPILVLSHHSSLSSQLGTHSRVEARFWPWLSGVSLAIL